MLKELRQIKKRETKSTKDPVDQVTKLIEYEGAKDIQILRHLSPQSNLSEIEKMRGNLIEMEKLDKMYDNDVFTLVQIRNLAIDYKLRFLQSKYFKGNFDVQVAKKIREFGEKTGAIINEVTLQQNFYILAPEDMFFLEKRQYIKDTDPAIFYKIDENHFKLVHKWGSDFTPLRYIKGFIYKSARNHYISMFLGFMLLFGVLFSTFFSPEMKINNSFSFMFFQVVFSALAPLFFLRTDELKEVYGFYSTTSWNRKEKVKV